MIILISLFSFLILIFHHTNGQNSPNISMGSTFTAGNNSTLLSSSEDFAFGFYPVSDTLFLVGIRFNKIQENTRLLVLNYVNGTVQQIYSGAASLGISQDDGNLALRDSRSNNVWEIFKFSTDTLLPGQTLLSAGKFYSNSNSSGNLKFSTGKFMLEMQYDGKLVLSAYHFRVPRVLAESRNHYEVNLVFNKRNASLYLVKGTNNNTNYSFTSNVPSPVEDYYHGATLDSFGNFQQYAYHKTNGRNWIRVWKIPSEPCMVNAVLGVYGFCSSNDNETVDCDRLPGYIFFDPSNPNN
ncbi:unnamed protein product [Withania somnifera]